VIRNVPPEMQYGRTGFSGLWDRAPVVAPQTAISTERHSLLQSWWLGTLKATGCPLIAPIRWEAQRLVRLLFYLVLPSQTMPPGHSVSRIPLAFTY
jgi:hypothetical protein